MVKFECARTISVKNPELASVTVSIGVAVRSIDMKIPDQLIKRADEAAYTAKQIGRNRVAGLPADKVA